MTSSFPLRFTVCSYNLWNSERWAARETALRQFLDLHRPDIFCVQELHEGSRDAIDQVLGLTHQRVHDDALGWTVESNIWWNDALFAASEYGREDIGILEEHRGLFWVRLTPRNEAADAQTMAVTTAHFTWSGHEVCVKTGRNVRLDQARATVAALARLRRGDEPLLFMGDLNDSTEPITILRTSGLTDCFAALGRSTPPTWPATPTAHGAPQSIDWLMATAGLRAMTAEVVEFWAGDIAPSDHKPVLATYSLPLPSSTAS